MLVNCIQGLGAVASFCQLWCWDSQLPANWNLLVHCDLPRSATCRDGDDLSEDEDKEESKDEMNGLSESSDNDQHIIVICISNISW